MVDEVSHIAADRRLAADVEMSALSAFHRFRSPAVMSAEGGGRGRRRRGRASALVFVLTRRVTPIPTPSPIKGEGRGGGNGPYNPNSTRGIRPISEPVRQVARKPAIIAFHTRLSTSWRRWGTSTEKPATFMPTEPMLAKPHSA